MRTRRLKLFFDGGCRPNPGVMEVAVVVRGTTHHRADLGYGSNNDAEWLALLAALAIARDLGATDIELLGDSAFVVDQANGTGRNGADWQRYLAEYRALAASFTRLRVRRIGRSQNLAGIALERIHGRL